MIGVVRHAVNTSAGNSACWGKISFAPHAAKRIQSFVADETGLLRPHSGCCQLGNPY